MIINLQKLIESSQIQNRIPPKDKLQEERAKVEKELLDSGYDKRCPKLFSDISNYVALWRLDCIFTGFLMIGNCGCGKTEGARRLSGLLGVEFVTSANIMESFGSTEYYHMIKQPDFFSRAPGHLIIDELGTEVRPLVHYGTKYNVMADVMRERYDAFKFHGARTIITTNLTVDELDEAYGERVSSRCWEMFKVKSYKSEDFRKKS